MLKARGEWIDEVGAVYLGFGKLVEQWEASSLTPFANIPSGGVAGVHLNSHVLWIHREFWAWSFFGRLDRKAPSLSERSPG